MYKTDMRGVGVQKSYTRTDRNIYLEILKF